MKVLGENFIAKMKAWVMGREVWTSGAGTGSVVIVGRKNVASGMIANAEGYKGIARGNFSHAEGQSTTARGNNSHAEGASTTAIGDYSHAEGVYTTASGSASHAEGAYNVVDPNAIHVVGVGCYGTNMSAEIIYYNPRNAKNGYKYLMGVGGYDGRTAVDVNNHKSVQEVIADLTARVEKLEKG